MPLKGVLAGTEFPKTSEIIPNTITKSWIRERGRKKAIKLREAHKPRISSWSLRDCAGRAHNLWANHVKQIEISSRAVDEPHSTGIYRCSAHYAQSDQWIPPKTSTEGLQFYLFTNPMWGHGRFRVGCDAPALLKWSDSSGKNGWPLSECW